MHPTHRDDNRIDIVAIPLAHPQSKTGKIGIFAINDWAKERLKIAVGMDVFVLGYPFGVKPPGLPVWKRGSIASEPALVRQTEGYYLVDTASRPGMSGAPVILRRWINDMEEPGVLAISDRPYDRFLGVYAGRLHAQPDDAQIGMVWHESYIDEIIDGNKRDN